MHLESVYPSSSHVPFSPSVLSTPSLDQLSPPPTFPSYPLHPRSFLYLYGKSVSYKSGFIGILCRDGTCMFVTPRSSFTSPKHIFLLLTMKNGGAFGYSEIDGEDHSDSDNYDLDRSVYRCPKRGQPRSGDS